MQFVVSIPTLCINADQSQYPSQHVGFLEAKQATALEEFKRLAESKGYYRPAQGEKPASHDDETLLYERALSSASSRAKPY